MAKVRFKDLEYDIPDEFTNRELIEIEHVSGVPGSVVEEGLQARPKRVHYSTLLAWAWISIKRAGAKITLDDLLDAPVGSIEWVDDAATEEAEDGPLEAIEPEAESPTGPEMPEDDGTPSSPSSSE